MRHTLHPAPFQPSPFTVGSIVACPDPDCDQVAEIIAVWDWPSTSGFMAHARTRCLARHVFTPRLDSIVSAADHSPAEPTGRVAARA